MAQRKQAVARAEVRDDLVIALERSRAHRVTEEELHEQRISFAFGQAMNIDKVTKDSVRTTAQKVRLRD